MQKLRTSVGQRQTECIRPSCLYLVPTAGSTSAACLGPTSTASSYPLPITAARWTTGADRPFSIVLRSECPSTATSAKAARSLISVIRQLASTMKTILAALLIAPLVVGHSWLECTNYDVRSSSSNTLYWNASACSGHARCGGRQATEGFGVDTGFDFRPLLAGRPCQCAASSASAYGGAARMATYVKGQRVCVAYPAKNHVADVCTNAYIPDAGVRIFRTRAWPTAADGVDPPLRQWPVEYTHANGRHDDGRVDYKGFQHCPKFCQDKGRALCSLCFQLEDDLAPGKYTFQWQWSFNSVDDLYATCWEAIVAP
ncbi:Aste57867_736 [Aphanomyces stellatus]|uniref:Aste57867_736 protein n=1 Tax=Aphanomyces stellatus TaxID=120398 RepID=A0A485K3P4_9STRA|nr:hypothetical protein As57867_000735 [Aphanomyces stellatus]VFT77960.1 Aste57867_736 [Aphanomyces stellatus]